MVGSWLGFCLLGSCFCFGVLVLRFWLVLGFLVVAFLFWFGVFFVDCNNQSCDRRSFKEKEALGVAGDGPQLRLYMDET